MIDETELHVAPATAETVVDDVMAPTGVWDDAE